MGGYEAPYQTQKATKQKEVMSKTGEKIVGNYRKQAQVSQYRTRFFAHKWRHVSPVPEANALISNPVHTQI
jgi:hypothetical protein